MNRRDMLAGLAASSLGLASAPAWAKTMLARSVDLKGDIAILRRAYTLLHPGLHRYATPQKVAARFDRLERDFAACRTLPQAYLTLSRFLGTVRCGHTYANFYNQSDEVAAGLFAGRDKLPIHFRWLQGRMVVTRNFSADPRLAPGAEIVSLDGRAPQHILQRLTPFARADGGNDAKRRALMEVSGFDRFETFDVFYPLLFPVRDEAFTLRVSPPGGGKTVKLEVPAIDLPTRRAGMRAGADAEGDGPVWTCDIRPDGVAILTMPNWALYDSKWDWAGFLDDAFVRIAAARALIVDVRGNEGGLDCGDAIIAHLIDRDLPLLADERRVRYRSTPEDLNPWLDTWDKSFRNWGDDAVDLGDGFYRLKSDEGEGDVGVIRPKGPRFTGKVIVLTDAQNSSATFQFAQRIRDNGLGQLCGAPTGGNQRGINGGAFFFLRLPASGLEADLPLIGRFPRDPKPDAGLTPDIAVEDSPADIAAGRDRVMEAALAASAV